MYLMYGRVHISFIVLCGIASAQAKTPDWAKRNTQSVNGKIFSTTCSGTGPSLDTARKEALDSCQLSARQQLVSNIKVRSLTIQTEKSSGFHEEVSDNTEYVGLTCIPEKDEVEELDGSFRVWMQCRFNLSKVSVSAVTDATDHKDEKTAPAGIQNSHSLSMIEEKPASRTAESITSDQTTLSISSIPKCESLIVRGPQTRVIPCRENPILVILEHSDSAIIVRAKGYKPKTISLGMEKKGHENVDVILDPL